VKVVIIGANGQDGRYLRLIHESYGDEVIGVIKRTSLLKPLALNNYSDDLADPNACLKFLSSHNPDLIYHVATIHGSSLNMRHVLYQNPNLIEKTHLEITKNVIAYLKLNLNCKALFTLSSKIFKPDKINTIIDETSIPNPTDLYGRTKLAMLNEVESAKKNFGINACCPVLFNHSSIFSKDEFLFPTIANSLRSNIDIEKTVLDLDTRIDICYAYDICLGLYKIATSSYLHNFVLGSSKLLYLPDILTEVLTLLQKDYSYKINKIARFDKPTLVSNCDSALDLLNWQPKVAATALLIKMINREI
jgi:nucleoside-diphosphate-sugar epimerase